MVIGDYLNFGLDRDDLEDKLGGGIPKGSLIIIEGNEGSGKSIIAQRLTYGFLENEHSVTYISTELSSLDFVKQMDSLDYPILNYLLSKKLIFISTLNFFGKIRKNENLILKLRTKKAKKLFEQDIIIIDSLSYPLVNGISKYDAEIFIDFLMKIKALGKIIILTYDPLFIENLHPLITILKKDADIYLKTSITNIAGNAIRFLDVVRFRRAKNIYEQRIPFRVEPGVGFIIDITSLI